MSNWDLQINKKSSEQDLVDQIKFSFHFHFKRNYNLKKNIYSNNEVLP